MKSQCILMGDYMMRYVDMFWASDTKWFYFDGLVPKIREDAPKEVKESFENYLKQQRQYVSELKQQKQHAGELMLQRLENLEERLRKRYTKINLGIDNDVYFLLDNGEVIHLVARVPFEAIVIEHAENIEEAKKYMFEDGDLFYMDEFDEEQMFNEMIKEIED